MRGFAFRCPDSRGVDYLRDEKQPEGESTAQRRSLPRRVMCCLAQQPIGLVIQPVRLLRYLIQGMPY